jgi:hypothetical protein
MKSIVRQLQLEASNSETSVVSLLSKAKIIAVKLELNDFLSWIKNETEGYNIKTSDELPPYRVVGGHLRAFNPFHGWQPIIFQDSKIENLLSTKGVTQSIGELESIYRSSKTGKPLCISINSEATREIIKAIKVEVEIRFFVDRSEVAGILDGVRNSILDWSLKLDEMGILDKDLDFSDDDKKRVLKKKNLSQINIIGNFTGNIGDISKNKSVSVGINQEISIKEINNLLKQIKKYSSKIKLNKGNRKKFNKTVSDLDEELKKDEPEQSRIINILKTLKNILESAMGSILAYGIIEMIQKMIQKHL